MGLLLDRTNKQYGKLTAIEIDKEKSKASVFYWKCLCDCGNTISVLGGRLTTGTAMSCGCLRRLHNKTRAITHGKNNTPEHGSWRGMKNRCTNAKCDMYKYYGGKGIKVCSRWINSFENFYEDMGEKPLPKNKYSLDRIDSSKGYNKKNCRWADATQQSRNSSNNRLVEINGETICCSEAIEKYGAVKYATFQDRVYRLKWDLLKAILTPNRYSKEKLNELQNNRDRK